MFDKLKRMIFGTRNPTADLEFITHNELVIDVDRSMFNSIPLKSSFEQIKQLGRASEANVNPDIANFKYSDSGFEVTLENGEFVEVSVTVSVFKGSQSKMKRCKKLTIVKDGSAMEIKTDTSFQDLVAGLGVSNDGYDFCYGETVNLNWTIGDRVLEIEVDGTDGVGTVDFYFD